MSHGNHGNHRNFFLTQIAQITLILYLSLADSAESADIVLLMSRRKKGNKRKVYPLDGYIDGGRCIFENKLSPYITHINGLFILQSE